MITVTQGADRTVIASNIVDVNNQPLDVTGWTVRAALRAESATGPLIAEWSTTPIGDQIEATALSQEVRLPIPASVSAEWSFTLGVLQAELVEPVEDSPRTERIIDEVIYLDPEAVV